MMDDKREIAVQFPYPHESYDLRAGRAAVFEEQFHAPGQPPLY
jgi:hypothetical protein